jgi:glycosyltransferase involved in cell wall biosynthesis
MFKKLVVFPNDPIYKYYQKGEIKPRYYNPNNLFDEVHLISLCDDDISADKVQMLAGSADLKIHSIGRFSPYVFKDALKLVEEIKPDVIRGHGIWKAGTVATWVGKKLNIPVIVSVHNELDETRKFNKGLKYKLAKIMERYCISHADCVISVSNHVEKFVKKYNPKRSEVIYNKVYIEQFSPNGKPKNEVPVILSVMRLDHPQKDPETLMRAVEGLDVKLIIIGQGELKDKLNNIRGSNVELIYSVPNTEIHKYYQKADIFAMATNYEGFCIPLLEAMASGVPVVANGIEPVYEILNGAGLTTKKTPESFRVFFKMLLQDSELYSQCCKEGLQRAKEINGTIMEDRESLLYKEYI